MQGAAVLQALAHATGAFNPVQITVATFVGGSIVPYDLSGNRRTCNYGSASATTTIARKAKLPT